MIDAKIQNGRQDIFIMGTTDDLSADVMLLAQCIYNRLLREDGKAAEMFQRELCRYFAEGFFFRPVANWQDEKEVGIKVAMQELLKQWQAEREALEGERDE